MTEAERLKQQAELIVVRMEHRRAAHDRDLLLLEQIDRQLHHLKTEAITGHPGAFARQVQMQ